MDPSTGKLPDEILGSILRWLPMREAVKTSLVSKSWRYLWALFVADIDFDQDDIPGISVPDDLDNYQEHSLIFARTVDHFLSIHGATKIDTLRIRYPIGDEFNKHVDDWVRAAIRKQAKKLILNFHMFPDIPKNPNYSSFPLHLLDNRRASSQLNHLQLDSCNMKIPDQFCGLASLKTLVLENVTVSNVQSLISSCCLLESVTILHCRGVKEIKFGSSLGRLKHIKLEGDELMHVRLVNYDDQVFSSSSASPLTHLHLVRCISPQSKFASFKNLQELTLAPVIVRDRDIWSLLSHCSHLQRLRLLGGGSHFRHFKIPFSSHPLKYLELKDNKFLDKVDLCSAKLAFLELHTTLPINLRVKQAPKLTRVSLGSWSVDTIDVTIKGITELPSLIPRLETLTLFVGPSTSATGEAILAKLPEFKHLKRLVIACGGGYYPLESCLWMVLLIHIAPELQIFELHLGHTGFTGKPNSDSPDEMEFLNRAHDHLKEVKISGFRGHEYEINMAVYLLKYARSLELMTIETHDMKYEGDDTWKIYKHKPADPYIRRRLMKHVSSSTKLVI